MFSHFYIPYIFLLLLYIPSLLNFTLFLCWCLGICYCLVAKSCLTLFANPWTVAHQAPLSMGFPRQEYQSELPFPFPGHLPDPGIKPVSPELAGGFSTTQPPRKPNSVKIVKICFSEHHIILLLNSHTFISLSSQGLPKG